MTHNEQVATAIANIKSSGFTTITPPIFDEVMATFEFAQVTDVECRDCGDKMYQIDVDSYGNRCGSCAWFEAMTLLN